MLLHGSKPSARVGHTLTAVDEKRAILFGGFDGKKELNDVWLFDGERKVVSCCCFVYLFCCDCWCAGVVSHHTILSTVATTEILIITLCVQWCVTIKRSRVY